jgi:hypothetical protein
VKGEQDARGRRHLLVEGRSRRLQLPKPLQQRVYKLGLTREAVVAAAAHAAQRSLDLACDVAREPLVAPREVQRIDLHVLGAAFRDQRVERGGDEMLVEKRG